MADRKFYTAGWIKMPFGM